MNWLYITVMGYIIVCALRGFHKGFLRVVYSIVSLAVAVVFIAVTAPMLRNVILESTTIRQQIKAGSDRYVREQIDKKLEESTFTDDMELSWLTILPKELQKELYKDLNQTARSSIPHILESQGVYKKISEGIADISVWVIAFLLAFILILVILFFIGRKLDLFSRKPGIHLVNMIFGFLAGIVKAFLVIWVAFSFIELTKILPVSAALIRQIEENAVLKGLYEQNMIRDLLFRYLKL